MNDHILYKASLDSYWDRSRQTDRQTGTHTALLPLFSSLLSCLSLCPFTVSD